MPFNKSNKILSNMQRQQKLTTTKLNPKSNKFKSNGLK